MATQVHVINGELAVVAGPTDGAEMVRLKLTCHVAATPDYAIPGHILSNRHGGVPASFLSAVRLEVQLDFGNEDTGSMGGIVLGQWVDMMVKRVLALKFSFPCEVFVALTDASHPYSDRSGDLVAVGQDADGGDHPAVVMLANKGSLVQVGQTGY